jgi:hypothetical protein
MKKTRIILCVISLLLSGGSYAQFIIGLDDASNYTQNDYPNEGNLGTGFEGWYSQSGGGGGWFRGSATNNGASNASILNTSGNAFAVWADGFSDVGRHCYNQIFTGSTLSFNVSFQWDNGNKGISLYANSFSGAELFNFNIATSGYSWSGGGQQAMTSWDTPPGDRQHGVVLSFTFTTTDTGFDYEITAPAGDNGFGVKSGSITGGMIDAVKFYVSGAGGDGGNLYFNNFRIEHSDAHTVPETANVIINGDVNLFHGNFTVHDLNVPPGSSFTVNSGEFETSSIIVNGTFAGVATVERYITGASWSQWNSGWHLIASPVLQQPIQPEFVSDPPAINEDFYAWDEANHIWINTKEVNGNWNTGFENSFIPAKGYLVSYENTTTKKFTGILNTKDQATPLLTTDSTGWNMVGNPFPSAIRWNDGYSWNLGNIGGTAQLWSDDAKDYIERLEGSTIPAMNGFMVYTASDQTLTIPAEARYHSDMPWQKTALHENIVLVAHDPQGQSFKRAVIGFRPDATYGFDLKYDAFLLTGFAPKLYSKAFGKKLSVNMLPEFKEDLEIHFGFEKNGSTSFFIELAESIENVTIYLSDLKTGNTQNLTENPNYHFTSEEFDAPDRFILKFGHVGISESKKTSGIKAWFYENRIYVDNPGGVVHLEVFDLAGRQQSQTYLTGAGIQSISLSNHPGLYLIKINCNEKAETLKVIIQ